MFLRNVILFLLVLKTIWNSFSNNQELNIEELLLNRCTNNIPPIFQESFLPTPNLVSTSNMVNTPNIVTTPVCQSSFSFNKIIIIGFVLYLIFFIRDILENICSSDEETDTNRCPFLF